MLYIPKNPENLNVETDEEVKYFVHINFRDYFESVWEKLYSKLSE